MHEVTKKSEGVADMDSPACRFGLLATDVVKIAGVVGVDELLAIREASARSSHGPCYRQ